MRLAGIRDFKSMKSETCIVGLACPQALRAEYPECRRYDVRQPRFNGVAWYAFCQTAGATLGSYEEGEEHHGLS